MILFFPHQQAFTEHQLFQLWAFPARSSGSGLLPWASPWTLEPCTVDHEGWVQAEAAHSRWAPPAATLTHHSSFSVRCPVSWVWFHAKQDSQKAKSPKLFEGIFVTQVSTSNYEISALPLLTVLHTGRGKSTYWRGNINTSLLPEREHGKLSKILFHSTSRTF